MKSQIFFLLLVAVSTVPACWAASKIVVVYPVGSKSHLIAVMPIVEELAQRGHQITLVTSFKVPISDSISMIYLNQLATRIEAFSPDWFGMSKQGPAQIFTMISHLKSMLLDGYELLMANAEFKSLIESKDVDLFIVDAMFTDFIFPIIDQLKVPFVLHSSGTGVPMILQPSGVSMDYASIPTALNEFDDQMNFIQRLINTLQAELVSQFTNWFVIQPLEESIRLDIPNARPLAEIRAEASLLMINSHPATDWPRSLPPSVIPIGALHTRPAKPLPEQFKSFVDDAKEGLIIFTLGSIVPVSSMPKETLQAFMGAFSKIPQKVIWKWESEIPTGVPSNIMMTKWLPQQDLLGHTNAKVFITHGGLLGFQESIYHAVPLLMLPFGNDQKANAAKARREGFGLKLDWHDIDEQKIINVLSKLTKDSSFKNNATRLSQLMRDELLPAKDIGAYWVEHVLRHKGTKHLQLAGKDMPFYQRYLLDVIAFLIGIVVFALITTGLLLRCIVLRCFGSSSAPSTKVKSKTH